MTVSSAESHALVWQRGGGQAPHSTTLNGRPLRFYDSPMGQPDFPWVRFTDAVELMEFPAWFNDVIVEQWGAVWPHYQHELLDGTVIVPDFAVTGMLSFYARQGLKSAERAGEAYVAAANELFARLHAEMNLDDYRLMLRWVALRNIPVEGMGHAN